jgi:biopolymer transport protein ExbB
MKKFFALLGVAGMLAFGATNVNAQDETVDTVLESKEEVIVADEEVSVVEEEVVVSETSNETTVVEESLKAQIKEKFIEGGPGFMALVLIALVLGLALSIERIIYLNMSTTNTKKLLADVEAALKAGGVDAAKEVCRNTRGPIASIFYQGLDRSSEGIDVVEKSVVAYGGVQMGLLEKNLSWISLFIALAPMLGFLGTVIGMISAFDDIESAGTISATVVAGGIKQALLTTVAGLLVAIVLQVFYNYIVSKVESIVNKMEDASISLVDILVKNNIAK